MKKEILTVDLNEELSDIFTQFDDDAQYETHLTVYSIDSSDVSNGLFEYIHESFDKNEHKLLFEYIDSSDDDSSYGPYGGAMTVNIYVSVSELTKDSILKLFKDIYETCDYFSI
jgi:hypothetical protein